jgi:H+-transporting ATPase
MPELQKRLGSSPDGLTAAEAGKRQAQYGPNEIAEAKTNVLLKFLGYFWGPIPWMIEGAVVLSGVVRHWLDFFIILLLLCSIAVVGFWEEHQAGRSIAALKVRLAILAKDKRDGKWVNPKASELVPGDVIRLRLGEIVPADARLLEGDSIEVDQSALTGESLGVDVKMVTGDQIAIAREISKQLGLGTNIRPGMGSNQRSRQTARLSGLRSDQTCITYKEAYQLQLGDRGTGL